MKKTYLLRLALVIFIGLFFCCFALHAMEIQYPEVNGVSINNETTPTVYIVYFFNLLVGLGGIVAFIVLVKAGVQFMMAGGEPGKVSEARNQMVGAFIGLIVLYSSYLILSKVNKDLIVVNVEGINCESVPICVEKTTLVNGVVKKTTEMSIPTANKNLDLQEGESLIIKKYTGLKEIWGFTEPDFKGSAIPVWRSVTNDPNEVAVDIDLGASNAKSYRIINKMIGIYLYDKPNFEVNDGAISPFILTSSVDDFNSTVPKFIKTESAETVSNMDKTSVPYAIFFSEPKFRGYCAKFPGNDAGANLYHLGNNLADLKILLPNAIGAVPSFGNDNLASAIVYHVNENVRGDYSVTFYSETNCSGEFFPQSSPGSLFAAMFANEFKPKSMRLDSGVGVVLMQADRCQYFSAKDFCSGNCICSILESDVPDANAYGIFAVDN